MLTPAQVHEHYDRVTLLLQGGGALGAYQAGAYATLHHAGVHINSVFGISIGALNACVLAGNAPAQRLAALQGFWQAITRSDCAPPWLPMPTFKNALGGWGAACPPLQRYQSDVSAWQTMVSGQQGFFRPRWPVPPRTDAPDELSLYRTDRLKDTLAQYADLARINNPDNVHVAVAAVNVASGAYTVFCNREQPLGFEHFMASAALPPGFAAVAIDGQYYWDGGLVSNSPLADWAAAPAVPGCELVLQLDLWRSAGALPQDWPTLEARINEMRYASHNDMTLALLQAREITAKALAALPEAERSLPAVQTAWQSVCTHSANIICLGYRAPHCEHRHREYEFSADTMHVHWQSGAHDMAAVLAQPGWLQPPTFPQMYHYHYWRGASATE